MKLWRRAGGCGLLWMCEITAVLHKAEDTGARGGSGLVRPGRAGARAQGLGERHGAGVPR